MITYHPFRNADPPGLVDVWNECFTGRGGAFLRGSLLLEFFALAKPYFDPEGLIVAREEGKIVGFILTGFGPDGTSKALDHATGVTCALGVQPALRRRGIGSELLKRGEDYLRRRGVRQILAGPLTPLNAFTFGIYGGSDSPGFLESDLLARPFFEHRGYKIHKTCLVWQRSLEAPIVVADGRFAAYRQRFEIHTGPRRATTWWQESVLGPVELQDFCLVEKINSRVAARMSLWEMEPFSPRWNEHAVGIVELETAPELRRQGLARFLLAQVLRHLHEQFFSLAEVHSPEDDAIAGGLLRGLGFQPIDRGHSYCREPAP